MVTSGIILIIKSDWNKFVVSIKPLKFNIINVMYDNCDSGWLLTRSPMQQDVIFNVCEQLFPPLYTNITQFMEPKMDVSCPMNFYVRKQTNSNHIAKKIPCWLWDSNPQLQVL